MVIRPATLVDIPAVVSGCVAMLKETSWYLPGETMDVVSRAQYLRERLERDPNWRLYVADDDGVLAGFIGVEIANHPLHPQSFRFIREWAQWVRPQYRGQRLAWQLMEKVCEWGREVKVRGVIYAKPLTKTRPKRGPVEQLIWIDLEG